MLAAAFFWRERLPEWAQAGAVGVAIFAIMHVAIRVIDSKIGNGKNGGKALEELKHAVEKSSERHRMHELVTDNTNSTVNKLVDLAARNETSIALLSESIKTLTIVTKDGTNRIVKAIEDNMK